jgi:hypothetical protein
MQSEQIFQSFLKLIHEDAYWIGKDEYESLLKRMQSELDARLAARQICERR